MWSNIASVLVPVDSSDASFEALDKALTMVAEPGHVHVVHVLADLTSEADFLRERFTLADREEHARRALEGRLTDSQRGVNVLVKTGAPGQVIADTARELGCDLIVMPSHGRTGVSRILLGSVAERVLRLAECPVLVLKGPSA